MNNELNELESAQVRTLVYKIRDADVIEIIDSDNEYRVDSPDNFKLSLRLSGNRFWENQFIINIADLADAKIINNTIYVKAYVNGESRMIELELYTKTRMEIDHLAT